MLGKLSLESRGISKNRIAPVIYFIAAILALKGIGTIFAAMIR